MKTELPVERKPDWLRVKIPSGDNVAHVGGIRKGQKLFTVCEEANCPNKHECWSGGTATFMLMGGICTRGCKFCSVTSGKPDPLDITEPTNVAQAVKELNLNYVVLTSVDRDDLDDGGSMHFARCISKIREINPKILIEVLIPDFLDENLKNIIDSSPDVIAHNVETVERLTPKVRDPRANYKKSLEVLRSVKEINNKMFTKSSLMVGLGEIWDDIEKTFEDLAKINVDFLTIGQYLRPSRKHLKVEKYIHPDVFKEMKVKALDYGFRYVASGPLVRSSYKAGEFFIEKIIQNSKNS
ncbi:MAG: lipoyl synthase [Candidatus Hodarchaeales archaeon]|jgi:lipoic acid synthetase